MQAGSNAELNTELEELVKKAQEGHAASFAALYEHFFDKIFRYVSFKTGSAVEAEDIAGDVFVKMLESINSFKWQGYPFSSWLFRIAHNMIVDYFRKKSRKKTAPIDAASIAGREGLLQSRRGIFHELAGTGFSDHLDERLADPNSLPRCRGQRNSLGDEVGAADAGIEFVAKVIACRLPGFLLDESHLPVARSGVIDLDTTAGHSQRGRHRLHRCAGRGALVNLDYACHRPAMFR